MALVSRGKEEEEEIFRTILPCNRTIPCVRGIGQGSEVPEALRG